jgi:hypothetical protein
MHDDTLWVLVVELLRLLLPSLHQHLLSWTKRVSRVKFVDGIAHSSELKGRGQLGQTKDESMISSHSGWPLRAEICTALWFMAKTT